MALPRPAAQQDSLAPSSDTDALDRCQLFAGLQSIVLMRRLEERIMFDGAALATADMALEPAASDAPQTDATDAAPEPLQPPAAPQPGEPGPLALLPDPRATTVVFIDPSVRDAGAIVAAAGEDAEFVLLDPRADGLSQIAAYLEDRGNVSAIHIVSHGEAGELHLGSERYDAADLRAEAAVLRMIGESLGRDGDILVYGCNVAAGSEGAAFVQLLADLTDADVAASTDDTGSSALGGDFDLEARTGMIEASPITPPEFQGILAPLTIRATGLPTTNGLTGVGAVGLWENAGTIGSTAIDIRATVISATPGTIVQFDTAFGTNFYGQGRDADDMWIKVTGGTATITWEIFASGTGQTVAAVGDPNFRISDIDGDPFVVAAFPTLEVESVAPDLNGLTSYVLDNPTNLLSGVSGDNLSIVGTTTQGAEPNSLVAFSWSSVSSWEVTYSAQIGWGARFFFHDGDGDFTFVNPNTTFMLGLDLDADNSAAPGTSYQAAFTENGPAVGVVDADVDITQHAVLGTDLHSATVTLTNAKAFDQLLVSGSSAASGTVNGLAYTVTSSGGQITVALSGTASLATYEAALQAISFNNTSESPDTASRIVEVSVTNATFGTTSNFALSTIQVNAVNDVPTSGAIAGQSSADGESVSIPAASVFADADSDVLSYSATGLPAGLTIDPATGVISGTLTAVASQGGAGGVHTVTVTASDGQGGSVQSSFSFSVTNPAPDASDDAIGVGENGPSATGNIVSANDRDGGNDSDTLAVVSAALPGGAPIAIGAPVTLPSGAILTLQPNGTYIYDPNGAFEHLDSGETAAEVFTYQISDGQGGTDTATVTITINGANDAPAAGAIASLTKADGEAISIPAGAAFSDPDIEALAFSATGLPAWLTIDPATGSITGTAPANASAAGPYVITVTASDGTAQSSASFTLSLVNPAPLASADSNQTHENASQVSGNVLGNDQDGGQDGDSLSISSAVNSGGGAIAIGSEVTLPSGAKLTLNADGTYVYKPNGAFESLDLDESATDTFAYTLTDSQGATSTATVTITIDGRNDAPQAGTLPARTLADGDAVSLDLGALFSDPDIEPLTFTISGLPAGLSYDPATGIISGTVDRSASQSGLFAAPGGGSVYRIEVAASDGDAEITRSFNLTVTNPAPDARDDGIEAVEDGPAVTGNVVAANDVDGGGDTDTLTVTAVGGSTGNVGQAVAGSNGGLVTIEPDGSFTFDPAGDFEDLDAGEARSTSVTYTISDGEGGTDTATVTFTVHGRNDAPVAIDNSRSLGEDATDPATGSVIADNDGEGVDSDIDGDTLTVKEIAGTPVAGPTVVNGAYGTLTINPDGSYSYALDTALAAVQGLAAGETLTETFAYTIGDGEDGPELAVNGSLEGTAPGVDRNVHNGVLPPNWTLSGTPDVFNSSTNFNGYTWAPTPDGGDFLHGIGVGGYQEGFQQELSGLVPGQQYTLTFSQSIASSNWGGSGPGHWQVTFGGETQAAAQMTTPALGAASPWQAQSLTFTATSPTQTLHFAAVGDGGGNRVDLGIDGISIATRAAGGVLTDTADLTITINGSNDAPVAADDLLAADEDGPAISAYALDNDSDVEGDPLTVVAVNGAPGSVGQPVAGSNGGTFVLQPDGTLSFDPAGGFEDLGHGETRTTTLSYTISDGEGGSDTATVTVTVTGSNDAPDAVADTGFVSEGGVTGGDALANDSDPDAGDVLTVSAINGDPALVGAAVPGSAGGTFTVGPAGAYSFDPAGAFEDLAAGETRTTSISYTIEDGHGGSDTATITITVTGENDAPLAVGAVPLQETSDGAAIAPLGLLPYFADPDASDVLTLSLDPASLPPGLAFDPATGTITGTLDNSASQGGPGGDGTYPITVTATDPHGATVTTTLVYHVVNPAPVAVDDVLGASEDGPATMDVIAGSDHDTAPDSDALHVAAVNGDPALVGGSVPGSHGGAFSIDATGALTFDPAGDFEDLGLGETRTTTVSYTISDGEGGSDIATVTVTVTGVNDAPFVADPLTGEPAADPDAVVPVQLASDGATPAPLDLTPFFGDPDASDTLTLSLDPSTLPPGLVFDPVAGTITGTLDHSASQGGPAGDGTYPVTVTATDPHGASVTTTVVYRIGNLAPVAADDALGGSEDAPVSGNVIAGSDHDTAPDSDALHVAAVNGNPALVGAPVAGSNGGTFVLQPDGTLAFDPAGDFDELAAGQTRTTTIAYTISDGEGGTDLAAVTVTVTGVNDAPVATGPVPQQSVVDGETVAALALAPFFADPDASDTLAYSLDPASLPPGLAFDPATGTISGTLSAGASQGGPAGDGRYPVVVTATDPHGASVTATVLYDVGNPPPVAADDTFVATEGAGAAGNVISGSDLDGAPDSDALHVVEAGVPIAGSHGGLFTFEPDGSLAFDPAGDFEDLAAGETRVTTVSYTVSDGQGGTDVATVTVTVTGLNDAPVAADDTATTPENSVLVVTAAAGLLANDGDVDASDHLAISAVNGDPASIESSVPGTGGGEFTVRPDGSYTFDPGADFDDLAVGESRTTQIAYTVTDGNGGSDTAVLTITVTGTNDGPVVVDPANPGNPDPDPGAVVAMQAGVDGEAIRPLDLSVFFEDPDASDVLTYQAAGLPPGLSISHAAGVVSGTIDPSASRAGSYLVTVSATDPHGATSSVSFLWTVANPAPVAADDALGATEDAGTSGNVISGSDHDGAPDSDPLHVAAINGESDLVGTPVTGSNGGSFTLLSDGSLTFDPGADFQSLAAGETRATSIAYTISDGEGGTDIATVTVTVTGVNDGPLAEAPVPMQSLSDGSPAVPLDLNPYFADPDASDTLTLSLDPSSLPPGLVFDPATGTISGTADPSASVGGPNGDGVYPILVTATDPHGASVTTLVVYQVQNLPPVAGDDALASGEDAGVVGNVIAGSDHDTGPDADPLHVAAVNGIEAGVGTPVPGSNGGSFVIGADGTVAFDPAGDFEDLAAGETRTTSVTYTVSDGQGGTDTATLTVTVTGSNDGPVLADPAHPPAIQRGTDGSPIAPVGLAGHFADPDRSDLLTYTATGLPPGLTIDPETGIVSGTIEHGASSDGPYEVTVTATDPHGATVSVTFRWEVANPVPVALDDQARTLDGDPVRGSVAGNDLDPDGDSLTFSVVKGPKLGTLTMNPDGSYIYTPRFGAEGSERIVYEVRDADGGVTTAVLVIRVVPADAPINVSQIDAPAEPGHPAELPGELEERQPDDHGAIEVTWPNNVYIHFVVNGEEMKIDTQYGLGTTSELGRYVLQAVTDTASDNAGGLVDPLAGSPIDALAEEEDEEEPGEDDAGQQGSLTPFGRQTEASGEHVAPGFSAALERSREAFDRRAVGWYRDLARLA